MRAVEVLLTIIILIGIIYTVIPLSLTFYCFVIQPHMDHGDVFLEDTKLPVVGYEVEIYTPRPVPVYANSTYKPKTVAQLQTALQRCVAPQPYSKSFDCSELSAYTEYYLENNGFNTTISGSLTAGHAWCTVHNIVGQDTVHVECIPPVYIKQRHLPVELSYNNITEALAGDYPQEWVWWSQ